LTAVDDNTAAVAGQRPDGDSQSYFCIIKYAGSEWPAGKSGKLPMDPMHFIPTCKALFALGDCRSNMIRAVRNRRPAASVSFIIVDGKEGGGDESCR